MSISDDSEKEDEELDEQMNTLRDGIFQEAKRNICTAQQIMKRDYDKKNCCVKVIHMSIIMKPYYSYTTYHIKFLS